MVNLFPFKVNGNFCLLSLEAKKQVGVSKFVGGRCSAELGLFFKLNFDGAIEQSSRVGAKKQADEARMWKEAGTSVVISSPNLILMAQ